MHAEIVSVGHELLMGEVMDTNTAYLAQRLSEVGITVRWSGIVGDDLDDMVETFRRAHARSDVLVTTGGLGPTSDDLTREAVAAAIGQEMTVDPATRSWLEGVFARRGMAMPRTNLKQAMLIPAASTVPNPLGTAPGWWVERNGCYIVLFPGPPRELRRMWEETIGPRLARVAGAGVVATRTLKTSGITEGGIDEMLGPLFGRENPYLGIYAHPDGIHLRIIARAPDNEAARDLIAPVEEEIRRIVGHAVWGVDDETPGHRVGQLLAARGLTMGAVEGVSGGALAGQIARVPGHSGFYLGSLVIGPDGTRPRGLPISSDLPAGASERAAIALAKSARRILGADIGVASTTPAREGADERAGTYRIALVGKRDAHVALGRAAHTLDVTMQRAATLTLVELASALARRTI